MSLQELLGDLRARGITLSVEGDRLRCNAPKGSLTEELQQQLARRKFEVVRLLREAGNSAQPIPKVDRSQPLPLSFIQQRMWFLQRFQPDSPVYNITAFKRFASDINPRMMEAAVREIGRRHECLRTTFEERAGSPIQVIHRDCDVTLPVKNLTRSSGKEQENDLQAFIREQASRPFDLAAPLFRITLVRLAPEMHVFVFTVHHIVADGWSLDIFFRELGEIYDAISNKRSLALADLPFQYADYASWQREALSDNALKHDLAYWEQKLKALPGVLDLPTDFPRPTMQGFAGSVVQFNLSPQIAAGLWSLAQQEGASLFMILLTVFKALLHRYTNQPDIAVGTPMHTRSHPELENLIGCFINTLLLRTQLPAEITARELLRRVRETVLEGHAHLNVPFEKLVEVLQPERSLSHSALFQVSFNFQNTPRTSEFQTISVSSMFDLTLFMWEDGGSVCGAFEYNTDLFKESTIARMAEHLGVLAQAIAENPDQPVALLPILSAEERTELLDVRNRTETAYSREQTIPELFSMQAQRTPGAPAVIVSAAGRESARQVTYRELDLQSNRLAHRLRSLGVCSQSLVGICLDRSTDMIVALLGVLKAGGAYVPMDPHLPRERLAFMMEDAQLSLLLCDKSTRRIAPAGVRTILLDRDERRNQGSSDAPLENTASAEDLAYVIYTSGSTGVPKGVQVTHRSVVNLLESMRREPGLTAADRLLSVTTLSFDIAALEIYLPLISGACLLLASRTVAADGGALAQLLATSKATVMQATPVTWRTLLEAGWQGQPGLRIWCGGEAMPRELASELLRTGSAVWNLYGPTETTIWSTVHHVTADDTAVPIGKPVANTQVYILDNHRQLLPQGVPGELCIGGDGLARGYLNRPELTEEKFIPHPFVAGARLYRTGDLARWSADGTLQFLGRLDHQVKIRGLRIELEEIEHVLRGHASVQDAVAITRKDTSGEAALAAYIVPRGHVTQDGLSADLRRYLADRLPEYMIPPSFTLLDTFPLTDNGKVDRKSLPLPTRTLKPRTPPRNFLETQIATIWQHVLEVERIGVHDNFFELGGHSLLAVKLLAQMEKVFGPLPVSLLFQAPTVEEMAAKLGDAAMERERRAMVAIQPGGNRPPLFLVPGGTGDILSFTKVALGLGDAQPVYGFRFLGLDGEAPQERVEDIAAHLVAEILRLQPAGPCHLAGICLGGAVAFEMARQLSELGRAIGTVILIDTFPPSVYPSSKISAAPKLRKAVSLTRSAMGRVRRLRSYQGKERIAYLRRVAGMLSRFVFRFESPSGFRSGVRAEEVKQANFLAISRYQPQPYNGRLVLILQDGGHIDERDPRLQWATFSPNCEIRRFAAPSHDSMFEPQWVGQLAAELREALEEENAPVAAIQ